MAAHPLRRALRLCGIDIVRFPLHGTVQGHLKNLLRSESISLVLDVGANQGQFAATLRREVGFKGQIESFEPYPAAYEVCAKVSQSDNAWNTHSIALGSVDRDTVLHTYSQSEWNSLHGLNRSAVQGSGREVVPIAKVPCTERRLDSVWGEVVRPSDVVLIKSDTQGHELQVLEGVGRHVDQVAALLIEVSLVAFYEAEPVLSEVVPSVAAMGFTPSGFYPVTRFRNSKALTTIDVAFVKTPAATA